jgi:hypothetical protein
MPSKLPDISGEIAFPYTELDPAQVQALAKRYKFYKAYDLHGALTGTIDYSYLLYASSYEPLRRKELDVECEELNTSLENSLKAVPAATAKQRLSHKRHKAYLIEIEKRAKSLHEALIRMNTQLYYELHHEWPRPTSKNGWRSRIEGDMRSIARAAKRALNKMPQSKGGKPADPFYLPLIGRLIDIYRQGTDDDASYSHATEYYAKEPVYSGPLVHFVTDVLAMIGITRSNTSIGMAIERALKQRQEMST